MGMFMVAKSWFETSVLQAQDWHCSSPHPLSSSHPAASGPRAQLHTEHSSLHRVTCLPTRRLDVESALSIFAQANCFTERGPCCEAIGPQIQIGGLPRQSATRSRSNTLQECGVREFADQVGSACGDECNGEESMRGMSVVYLSRVGARG